MVQVKGICRLLTQRFSNDLDGSVKYSTSCPSRRDSPSEAMRAMPTSRDLSDSGSRGREAIRFALCSPIVTRQNRAVKRDKLANGPGYFAAASEARAVLK